MILELFDMVTVGCDCCETFVPAYGTVVYHWPWRDRLSLMNWLRAWLRTEDCRCRTQSVSWKYLL
jgi:hypothetical protein